MKRFYENHKPIASAFALLKSRVGPTGSSLNEAVAPEEGIYYIFRSPRGWELFGVQFAEFGDMDHSEMWEDMMAPLLAHKWSPLLKVPERRLESLIRPYTYGFPRGRVAKPMAGRLTMNILHGNDIPKGGPSRSQIERAFNAEGVAKWIRDEHEQCQADDRDALRKLFRLKETWKAVSFGGGDFED